ncbi:hypothetical protein Tco_0622307 [Tanacetum coccineum]
MIKSLQEFVRRLMSLFQKTEAPIAFNRYGRISSEHGILSEYCLHDICGCAKKLIVTSQLWVVPISNLISQCENMFLKSLNASGTEFDKNHQYGIIDFLENWKLWNHSTMTRSHVETFSTIFVLLGKRCTIYLHCYMKDAKLRNRIVCPGTDTEKSLKELESGRLHLLLLVHKFPAQQKFNSSIYAEAIILPWNLVYKREMVLVESSKGGDSCNEKWCDLKCIQVLVEKDID